ncbi:hypothetical protein WK78_03165 [Burkholderia cepacia]|uniref:hypothetical protein n=1 Tax=Burkholderia cepacia TaxID=292 RepID=UPI00075C9873|nr:hypothetical protein [Burkholderia cepacia]KVV25104.1 hypothetical protein WK78_03165 [Burkholderia cepacia]
MRNTVYGRMFDRLAYLIPSFQTVRSGAVFYAAPRHADDMAVYCCVTALEGDGLMIELADDRTKDGKDIPAPWLKLRVSFAEHAAEVLELEDVHGYQVIYHGDHVVNPKRAQLNVFAVNWLQTLINFEVAFRPVDVPVIA